MHNTQGIENTTNGLSNLFSYPGDIYFSCSLAGILTLIIAGTLMWQGRKYVNTEGGFIFQRSNDESHTLSEKPNLNTSVHDISSHELSSVERAKHGKHAKRDIGKNGVYTYGIDWGIVTIGFLYLLMVIITIWALRNSYFIIVGAYH